MKTYKVYKWTNKITRGVYFGCTSNSMQIRAGQNMNGYKSCTKFYANIQKYGVDAFSLKIIRENLTLKEAVELEQSLIGEAFLCSDIECYNSDMRSFNPDEDDRVGKIESTLRKQRGTPEYRKIMSERMAKVWASPERRQHMMEERRKKGRMGGVPAISIMVKETGKIYRTCKECSMDLGINATTICNTLKKPVKVLHRRDGSVYTFIRISDCGCKRK